MGGHGEKKSRKKEQAVVALLLQPSIGEAAKAAGIGESTLWRWLQQADFLETYRAAKREAVGQAVAQLQQASGGAVKTLADIMKDTGAPASARVSAAKCVLELAIKAVEIEDLSARVEFLEKQFTSKGAG